jgi:hypothetical protein
MTPFTGPSPNLNGIFLNFASLTPCGTYPACPATFTTYSADGVTISSADGFSVLPYSTQNPATPPNELLDDGSNGTADTTITTDFGTTAIGVGITDSDDDPASGNPVSIYLQPFGIGGTSDPLGLAFDITIPPDSLGNSDGYFAVEDSTPDIYGLEITQPLGNADFSGLAITDVQVAPEPASLPLMAGALLAMAGLVWRRRKKA